MESCIRPLWPWIVLTLAWSAGAQDSFTSQETATAAGQLTIAAARAPADSVVVAQNSDAAAVEAQKSSDAVVAAPPLSVTEERSTSTAADVVMAPPTAAAPDGAAKPVHEALQRYRKAQDLAPDPQIPPGGAANEAAPPAARAPTPHAAPADAGGADGYANAPGGGG